MLSRLTNNEAVMLQLVQGARQALPALQGA
jgi:hypothetical protein